MCERVGEVRRRWRVGGEHDGLETVEGRECAGSRLLGKQERGAPAGMAYADRVFEPERVDRCQDISPKTDPVEVQVRCHSGLAVPTKIGCHTVETEPKTACQRAEHPTVKACRVDKKSGRPVTPEIVQGQNDAIAGRGSNGRHCPCRLMAGLVRAMAPNAVRKVER